MPILPTDVRKWTLYKIVNPKNRVYIGITTNLPKRIRNYETINCLHQTALRYSLLKYGFPAHNFEVIETFSSTISEAYGKEIFWIRTYMSNYAKWPKQNGLNLTDGGRGSHGRVMSEETKQKLREANLGKKYSDETKAKLSAMKKGKKIKSGWTEDKRQRMSETKLSSGYRHPDEIKKIIGEAGRGNKNCLGQKQSPETIAKRVVHLKGNKFRLGHKGSEKQKEAVRKTFNKPIIQYDLQGNELNRFVSVTDAVKITGICHSTIENSAKGRIKKPLKFIFKYKKDVGFREGV